jgi:gluconate 2-dehydrogenase gamma chain
VTLPPPTSRRDFIASSAGLLGSGWITLHWPALLALSACARDAARADLPFTTLAAADGAMLRALAARIIPSDDGTPGAEEAGAAWFADRALSGLFAELLEPFREGLRGMDAHARRAFGVPFVMLTSAQQDDVIRAFEATEFFATARTLVVLGTFTAPEYGGNRDGVGWAMLGVEHQAAYLPPFGWYDARLDDSAGHGA